jgi:7-cyano-7-deazaguanine synthase
MKSLIVLSGGLDSTTCMALANAEGHDLMAVSFIYGQKHEDEVYHAQEVSRYYGAEHIAVTLPSIFAGTESTLVAANQIPNPQMSYQDIEESYGVSPTYVPYRNGNLLSMAAALALTHDAEEVWAGMHAEDAHNWAYPDCTPEFLGAMANAIYVGSYHKVRLVTPLQWMTKADVVAAGIALGAPFEKTMSCYEGADPACGVCPTCVGRINAFRANGLVDPIPYVIDIDWTPKR